MLAVVPARPLLAEESLPPLDEKTAANFAQLALACVQREYPNKIAHVLNSDGDVQPPRKLTPAFYGCYDWHSAVHAHWLLARLARQFPNAEFTPKARAALARSLTAQNMNAEARYMIGEGRASFERPYGLAWLLQLARELRTWDDPDARKWAANITPLEKATVDRVRSWLPKLSYPVRSGEHSQTAFALGLFIDYARAVGDKDLALLLEKRTRDFYLGDRACPIPYEPSGEDFLSPCLAEADAMRRVLIREEFAVWLASFLPAIQMGDARIFLKPAVVTDPTDGKLAHLDGLNLSRAWMLDGISNALPTLDPRRPAIDATRDQHARSGLAAVTGEHYEGGHWLASFATYLTTRAGLEESDATNKRVSITDRKSVGTQ
jgi:hypothetical protein